MDLVLLVLAIPLVVCLHGCTQFDTQNKNLKNIAVDVNTEECSVKVDITREEIQDDATMVMENVR